MTSGEALEAFAESLSRVRAAAPGIGAVLLADQLVLAGCAPERAGAVVGIDPGRAAGAAMRGSAGDADDVHWGVLVHPGAIIWPTVLEVGLASGASGADIARAAAVGHESMVRLARAIGPLDGFHLTSVVGGVAAAAAASVLIEGAVNSHALGHALSVAGGSSGAISERSGTRSFHRGHAVSTGLSAALAARDGVEATRGDLERGGGVLPPWDSVVRHELTTHADAIATTSLRPLPTSGWNHAAYEAARAAGAATSGAITRIAVAVPESTRRASAGATEPASEAWHHLSQSVVRAIVAVRSGQSLDALLRRVEIVDREVPGALVSISAAGGTSTAEVLLPLGHPARPLTTNDLALKWSIPANEVSALLDSVESWLTGSESAPPPPTPYKEQ